MGGIIFYLIFPRLISIDMWLNTTYNINIYSTYIVSGIMILFYLILGGGLTLITLTALTGFDLLYPHFKRSITVSLLFPIAATLSQVFRVNRNRLRTSFIKVNNALTKAQRKRISGDRILILLPHCLQIDICDRKITNDITKCVRCGRCPVGSILNMGHQYGLKLEVVNGGTLARRKVKSFRPTGIIAVACERDLTFGIQDVYPIPVYGVINDRPNGPCFNTCVEMSILKEAIEFFQTSNRNSKKKQISGSDICSCGAL